MKATFIDRNINMKKSAIALALLTFASFAAGANSAQAASAVCFYEHVDFDGLSLCAKGEAEVPAIRLDFNDLISSISIKEGWQVEVCQHANFEGWCKRYTGDVENIGKAANDQISSYRIIRADDEDEAPKACFFEHAEFQGRKFCLEQGEKWDAKSDLSWNDIISSMTIEDGLRVTVYEHSDFGGTRLKLRGDTSFVPQDWNDRISSIKVK
jgi:Peptidase inhibitor family I36